MIEMNRKATIGIVLSSLPKYSETFFKHKIMGLKELGFKVVLFVEYNSTIGHDFNCKVVSADSFGRNKLHSFSMSIKVLVICLLRNPKRCFNLFVLNRKDNMTVLESFKNVIVNSFLLKEKLDWLHFGYGMLAIKRENVAQAIEAKMAVSFRGADLYLTPLKHPNCYTKLCNKNVKYHVLSEEMQEDLMKKFNRSKSDISIIPPAINTRMFDSNIEINNTNKNKLNIITVARLHWKKGYEYTLEALALLKSRGYTFKYTIIGEGLEKERLIFAAHQLNILQDIEFTGQISQDRVRHYLENSDLYVQYSIQEGFCNALLEAQAMGLLCIASDAEGLRENVIDNETGWIVPKRQPKKLANKIIEIMGLSLQKKLNISQNARDRVRHNFTLPLQRDKFQRFYQD